MAEYNRRPDYLKLNPLDPVKLGKMNSLMRDLGLNTVCDSARCPNRTTCFAESTVTFMILGNTCTRHCSFCSVTRGQALDVDQTEPARIAAALEKLGMRYVVITSVTRDDLFDGGASHFARVIEAIHQSRAGITVEVLVPDFRGSLEALRTVIKASLAVFSHNLETAPRLYGEVRPEADYRRSLELLRRAKRLDPKLVTKSGIMLGLGESRQEVIGLMSDLREVDCDLLTIGQYLQPSPRHHGVVRYAPPGEYEEYQAIGREMGFASVIAGPLVRSSFHAAESYFSSIKGQVWKKMRFTG